MPKKTTLLSPRTAVMGFSPKTQLIISRQIGEMSMKKMSWLLILILSIGISPSISQAAIKYVRPGATGSNNGYDWTNAYTNLPTTLVRGDIYYLADGSYGSYTFDDANSGSTLITIKKATESDHGTNTGWASTYGDGQAIFSSWNITADYYNFDGQRRNTGWQTGQISEYGIRVYNANGIPVRLDNGGGAIGDNLTFQYIDFEGPGKNYLGDNSGGVDVIYTLGSKNVTFRFCALHDADRTIFLTRGVSDLLVEYSYIARNGSTPAIHGEIMSDDGSDNVTFRHNVIEDPEGTATWAILNGSGGSSGDANNWQIYGNVISHTGSYTGEGISGVVFCANDTSNNNSCSNWRVYNNTIYQIKGLWSGFVFQAGTGNIVQNNMWYNSVTTNNGGATFGYNWYYNTGANGDTSETKQTCTSNCNIFIDAINKDFRLKSSTNAGITLASPYNVDQDSNARGADGNWDRGAFEYGGQVTIAPAGTLR